MSQSMSQSFKKMFVVAALIIGAAACGKKQAATTPPPVESTSPETGATGGATYGGQKPDAPKGDAKPPEAPR